MASVLLHMCCAPCALYPVKALKEKEFAVTGYFDNPNIHPSMEYKRRRNAVRQLQSDEDIKIYFSAKYEMENFLRNVVYKESERCLYCYTSRLKRTALFAKEHGFESFSTTLLYSKYQNHELIRQVAETAALENGVSFYYEDFREGWQAGILESKKREYYRQPYCGCIYSEKERYRVK